jgi:hypothetical protein
MSGRLLRKWKLLGLGGGEVDPSFSSVKLLAGFEGLNGATTYTEESADARTVTFGGTAAISTAQSVFGASSLNVSAASSNRVSLSDSDDWRLGGPAGTEPFTVELRWRPSTDNNLSTIIIGQWDAVTGGQRSWALLHNFLGNSLAWVQSTDGTATTTRASSAWAPTLNTWYALAVDWDGTKLRLYRDGTMVGSGTGNVIGINSTLPLTIGASNAGANGCQGFIDEVRITKGVARYASDSGYTIATAAFPRS